MATQPQTLSQPSAAATVHIGGRVLPFTSIEDVARSYRSAFDRKRLLAGSPVPECIVRDLSGAPIARIGLRRSFPFGPDGYVDYSRCLFDIGEDA